MDSSGRWLADNLRVWIELLAWERNGGWEAVGKFGEWTQN